MNSTDPIPGGPPKLQPPGAGLPWWEAWTNRHVLFPLFCRTTDWVKVTQLFQHEGQKVLTLWDEFPAERLAERALIKRLSGIEDSSRFWSVAMTVEHLNIVGQGIRGIIGGLRRGQLPSRETRVQDVKPRGETAPADVRNEFVRLLAEESADAEPPVPRGAGPRAFHPWFGPIDAFQWHCLLGLHQRIHRHQIEAIRDALGGP